MFQTRASLLLLLLSMGPLACGGARRTGTAPTSVIGEDAISHVELTVHNLTKEEADAFKGQLDDQGDIENIVLKGYAQNTAVYELDIEGCECDLPAKVAKIQSQGFK